MIEANIHEVFNKYQVNRAGLSRTLGISEKALSTFAKTGVLPARFDAIQRDTLCKVMMAHGMPRKAAATLAGTHLPTVKNPKEKKPTNTGLAGFLEDVPALSTDQSFKQKDNKMLPRKATLSKKTLTHFGLMFDPLNAQLHDAKDVYLSPDMRMVVETLSACAKHGGAMALVGESGSGKTTLKQMLEAQLSAADSRVTYIEPYVLAMEDNDQHGKTLKSLAIAYAIIKKLDPLAKPKRDAQARFEQLHTLLHNNKAGGNHAVLVIEEAHALPIPTLKHLKRFLEMRKDGFKPLISIILIGQPELAMRLNPKNMDTREVSQRFDVMTVPPLNANALDFLKHKFKKANTVLDAVFDKGVVDALVARLGGDSKQTNHLYPLALCNLTAAALNDAAELGLPKVSADIVREVRV